MTIKTANIPGYPNVPLNIWGKSTMLLNLLYRNGLLPECHIYGEPGTDDYFVNGINVGGTEEQVTTSIWLMVERYTSQGHIDFLWNKTNSENAENSAETRPIT